MLHCCLLRGKIFLLPGPAITANVRGLRASTEDTFIAKKQNLSIEILKMTPKKLLQNRWVATRKVVISLSTWFAVILEHIHTGLKINLSGTQEKELRGTLPLITSTVTTQSVFLEQQCCRSSMQTAPPFLPSTEKQIILSYLFGTKF